MTCLVASHDSKWFVTASQDGTIVIWDTSCGTVLREWVAHGGVIYALALAPDSQRLVSAGCEGSGTLTVWDISNSDSIPRATSLEVTETVTNCAWSPDGAMISSASKDGTVHVWDARTLLQCDLLEDPAVSQPCFLRFSPDAQYLAWKSKLPGRNDSDGCVIWQPLTGKPPTWLISSPSRFNVFIYALAFSESGRIATSYGGQGGELEDNVIRIWDVTTGATLAVLAGHSKVVLDLSFSPDSRSLLSGAWDGFVKIWDVESCKEIIASFKHEGDEGSEPNPWGPRLSKACFSPDMRYIATAGRLTVQLWRTSDASRVTVFSEHSERVSHVTFSPNGEFLASGDKSGVVYIRSLSGFNA